jgi:hypothetical protein
MKYTKEQLIQIIKEELENISIPEQTEQTSWRDVFKEVADIATLATMNKSMGTNIPLSEPIAQIEELLASLKKPEV